jgi:secreted trypsin-like serine protease
MGQASICTGTFVSKTFILTAAHCVTDDKNDLVIKMGNSVFTDQKTISFNVISVKKNEDYQKTTHDLALIQVVESSQVEVVPVELLQESDSLNKKNMTLFGYGVDHIEDSDDEFQGAGELRSLKVFFQRIRINQNTFMIDQSRGTGACHGDSGGPAFISSFNQRIILAGVASGVVQSEDESDCTNQSVYTRVSAYKSWIMETVQELSAN